ncbi:MAG TPA: hypothetical protein VFB80_01675 [Pirellulaceae bacterium]|nr:hypothetical protein [Pirellulaceae bacterium]
MQDAEGQIFAKVLRQAGLGLEGGSQGVFCFTADGKLLSHANVAEAEPERRLLTGVLRKFDPAAALAAEVLTPVAGDKPPLPQPPPGALIVDVTSKVLGGYPETKDRRETFAQKSLGRDHLWIRADEAAALAEGKFPDSLARRLARYHLVDNTRGEPPMWEANEVKRLDLKIADGRISGTVHLETRRGDRGYTADIAGVIETSENKVTRLDLVAKGQFWGEGPFTWGAPPGKFPFAVACRLATEDCAATRVPPQAARLGSRDYLE